MQVFEIAPCVKLFDSLESSSLSGMPIAPAPGPGELVYKPRHKGLSESIPTHYMVPNWCLQATEETDLFGSIQLSGVSLWKLIAALSTCDYSPLSQLHSLQARS
jgi:hypothetical protein